MKKIIIIIVVIIALAAGAFQLFFRTDEKFEYRPSIIKTVIRVNVLKRIYADDPDSFVILKKMIMAEEGVTEADLDRYEEYLKEDPARFLSFLDSVETSIDSIMDSPENEIKKLIKPEPPVKDQMNQ
jgi:hypothetical protein